MLEQIVTWDVGCGQRNTMCACGTHSPVSRCVHTLRVSKAKKEYMHELEISHSFIH